MPTPWAVAGERAVGQAAGIKSQLTTVSVRLTQISDLPVTAKLAFVPASPPHGFQVAPVAVSAAQLTSSNHHWHVDSRHRWR